MRTRAQRANLAVVCAASSFQLFAVRTMRGPNWSIDKMPGIIKNSIETQAFLYNVNKKHYEQMVTDGMDFYNRYLKDVLETI